METKRSGPDETYRETSQTGLHGSNWIFPALLLVLLVLLLVLASFAKWTANPQVLPQPNRTENWTPSPQPTGETVSLEIDFGNGAKQHFAALPWQPEMTVADLMQIVSQFQPGIEYHQIGEGAGGFLDSLAGLENEGAGGRNWIYQVDGQHAHVSFCLEKLEPGMHVLWTFTDEVYNGGSDTTTEQ